MFSALRHGRVVSSTSEEEEALTEKFLKINCKYITDGKVSHTPYSVIISIDSAWNQHRSSPQPQCCYLTQFVLNLPNYNYSFFVWPPSQSACFTHHPAAPRAR